MRIQPFTVRFGPETNAIQVNAAMNDSEDDHVQFYILLYEPSHNLTHQTTSQAVPRAWIESWDTNEWVEDLIVESLKLATQIVGQEYILSRMGSSSKTTKAVPGGLASLGAASETTDF